MTMTSIPRRARKYAMQAPITPPPQITTRMMSPRRSTEAPRRRAIGRNPGGT